MDTQAYSLGYLLSIEPARPAVRPAPHMCGQAATSSILSTPVNLVKSHVAMDQDLWNQKPK